DSVVETFTYPSENIVAEVGVTIQPQSLWPAAIQLYVQVEDGFFLDTEGNAYMGITDKDVWNFTTVAADVTAPQILTRFPANESADVPVGLMYLELEFDENVQINTTSAGNLRLVQLSDGATIRQFAPDELEIIDGSRLRARLDF